MSADNLSSSKKNTLPAAARVKSRKLFERLFENGEAIWQPPIRLVFIDIPYQEENPVKFAVSAPKRRMKRAVDRNRTKRLIREAYRINNEALINYCNQVQKGIAIMFISQYNSPTSFVKTEEKIILLLRRLIKLHGQFDK